MTPQLEAVREWLQFVRVDLRTAELALAEGAWLTPSICFHCQQAAEKSLKAYLCFREQRIERTHDLVRLVESCQAFDAEFEDLREAAAVLTPYAVQARYPDQPVPTEEAARRAFDEATYAFDFVLKHLPAEVRPQDA